MDPNTRPRLSEIDIERIAYSAIGRHLRVMCVLCLLLLGLGFLLGHHVANLHARKIAHEFERQSGGYAKQIVELGHQIDMLRQSQMVDRNLLTGLCRDTEKHVAVVESLRTEIDSAEVLRSSLIASSLEQIEADRREALHQLEACRSADTPLKADAVTQMMTRIVDGQMDRLNRLLGKTVPASCPGSADLASLPLVPVSEAGPSPTMAAIPDPFMPVTPVAPAAPTAPAEQEITFFPPIQATSDPLVEARPMPAPAPAPVAAVPAPMPTAVSSSVRISEAVEVQPPAPPAPAPNPFPPASIVTSVAPEPAVSPIGLPTPADSAPSFAPAPPVPATAPRVPRTNLFFAPTRKVESAAVPPPAPRLIAPSTASAPAPIQSRLK